MLSWTKRYTTAAYAMLIMIREMFWIEFEYRDLKIEYEF